MLTAYVSEQHRFLSLHGCAGSPEPLMFAYAITAVFPCPDLNIDYMTLFVIFQKTYGLGTLERRDACIEYS